MSRPLLLVGAGGFGREVAEAVRAINAVAPSWELLGFVDDDPQRVEAGGVPVIGGIDRVLAHPGAALVVCTGHPGNYFSRRRLVDRLRLPDERYATLVHPAATVPPNCAVGPGSVVLAGAVLTTAVRIGAHVGIMPGVVLTHDDVLEDFVTVAAGAMIAGRVRVGDGAYIGAGSCIREDRRIGRMSLVGMGAVVTRDVPDLEMWVGVPARRLRAVDVPADLV